MSSTNDKKVEHSAPPGSEPAGRVEFDSRGNSVWRWARDVIESTSVLLKRLDNKDLALEPTHKVPIMRDSGAARGHKPSAATKATKQTEPKLVARHPFGKKSEPRDSGGGFDPYNSR